MRLTSVVVFLLLAAAITMTSAKNGKKKKKGKSNKKPPQWKPLSMPEMKRQLFYTDEGQDVSLDCRSKGKPRPKVEWFHNSRSLSEGDTVQIKRSGELTLMSVTTDQSGNYTCMVSNSMGTLEWTFNVHIQKKVIQMDLEGPRNITALSGSRAQFSCRVLNDPQAEIRWYKGKVEDRNFLPTGPPDDMLSSPTGSTATEVLVIEDLKKSDEGMYGCLASNVWTSKSREAYLTVIEPRPPKTTTEAVTMVPWYPEVIGPDLYPDTQDPYFAGTKPGQGNNGGQFDEDSMYITTKRPKNRGGGRKKNKDKKKKNKKNKHKPNEPKYDFGDMDNYNIPGLDPVTETTTTTTTSTTPELFVPDSDSTDPEEVWRYGVNKDDQQDSYEPDDRIKSQNEKAMEAEKGKTQGAKGDGGNSGTIKSWTLYTIVGAVGGVVLLIGIVGITVALCLRREDESVYKSTPV